MSAIEIRPLTAAETEAYTARGQGRCVATGCPEGCRYIAVYTEAARVARDLPCGVHAAAWAAQHHQPLPIPVLS